MVKDKKTETVEIADIIRYAIADALDGRTVNMGVVLDALAVASMAFLKDICEQNKLDAGKVSNDFLRTVKRIDTNICADVRGEKYLSIVAGLTYPKGDIVPDDEVIEYLKENLAAHLNANFMEGEARYKLDYLSISSTR